MKSLSLALTLLTFVTTARADVYVEITKDGDVPDGQTDYGIIFMYPYDLDVYVWGTGADTTLYQAQFHIGPTFGTWALDALGTINPGGQFAGPNTAGELGDPGIHDINLFDATGVPLPSTPATAMLIYDNFTGRATSAFAQLDVIPGVFYTGQFPLIHTIGVRETPEPATAVLLLLTVVLLRRR